MKIPFFSIILLGLFIGPLALIGQDVEADMARIRANYEQTTRFSADLQYRWYASHQAEQPTHELAGKIMRQGKYYYAQTDQLELLRTPKLTLTVSHEQQQMLVQAPIAITLHPGTEIDPAELLKRCKSVDYQELNLREGRYRFNFEQAPYERIELRFDRQQFLIRQITCFFAYVPEGESSKPRIEIHYQRIRLNERLDTGIFSEKRFFSREGKTLRLQPPYQHYHLTHYLAPSR